jgi:hypothetical protein
VTLNGKMGNLLVSTSGSEPEMKSGESPGSADRLAAGNIYVGGLVGIPDDLYPSVTRIGFHGCLRELSLLGQTIDPLTNIESSGIFPNCLPQSVGLVSFNGPFGGYVSAAPANIDGDLSMIFRFRTIQPDGIMLYTANADKSQFIAVMLVAGAVHLSADSGGDRVDVIAQETSYNDGEWHTVSVTKKSRRISLAVDDGSFDNFDRFQKKSIRADAFLLVGGLPRGDFVEPAILPVANNFIGCIADLAFGFDRVVSFADQIVASVNANLNVCPVGSAMPTIPSLNITEPDMGRRMPTTTPPPIVTTTAEGSCKLPRVAGTGEQLPEDEGAEQYGINAYSRKEYPVLPQNIKRK